MTSKYDDANINSFYDVVVDTDSFQSLREKEKGWNVSFTEEGLKNYEKYLSQKVVSVSVIGNRNRGKTFLLSKISGVEFPEGTSIKTVGLSLKYGGEGNNKYIVMDTAGLDTPLVELNEDNLKKDITLERVHETARDKQIMELFLQNFILNESSVVLVLIGQLNYPEQKLLTKLKKLIKKKTIIVVHNLFNLITKEQVEGYIENYLKKSMTFHVEERNFIELKTTKEKKTNEEEVFSKYFFENLCENTIKEQEANTNTDQPKKEVIHLVIANQNALGKYYNQPVYDYLKQRLVANTSKKKFDIFTLLTNHLKKVSEKIMEESIKNVVYSPEERKIYIQDQFKLRKCLIDELGMTQFTGETYQPNYCYYTQISEEKKKELNGKIEELGKTSKFDDEFVIEIELPGGSELHGEPQIEHSIDGEIQRFQITSISKTETSEEEKEYNIKNETIKTGKFKINFSIKMEIIGTISPKEPKERKWSNDGILKIVFNREGTEEEEFEDIDF